VVGTAEPSVDDDGAAAGLDGALPLPDLDGHVAVDDVAALRIEAELLQDMLAAVDRVDVTVVRVGRLLPGALVGNRPWSFAPNIPRIIRLRRARPLLRRSPLDFMRFFPRGKSEVRW